MFFDSHAHLTAEGLGFATESLLKRAHEKKVRGVINICTDRTSLEKGITLAKREKWIFTAGATTPHDVEEEGERMFPLFETLARQGKLIALGETGLDYHYESSPRKIQQLFLHHYLALALALHLPVILHCRNAFDDLYSILEKEFGLLKSVIIHCFTGTMKEAEKALERGYFLSFSGIVTFKKSKELQEVVRQVPLSQLLIETDAPFLAPESKRGEVNEPSYIVETAQKIADVKQVPIEEIASATWENGLKAFHLEGVLPLPPTEDFSF